MSKQVNYIMGYLKWECQKCKTIMRFDKLCSKCGKDGSDYV